MEFLAESYCSLTKGKTASVIKVNDEQIVIDLNRDKVPVALGNDVGSDHYYCGRKLGTLLIPGSDGTCGPFNGPQCSACQGFTRTLPPPRTYRISVMAKQAFRSIIKQFYHSFNPDKVDFVNEFIDEFKGKETEMLGTLEKKYVTKLPTYVFSLATLLEKGTKVDWKDELEKAFSATLVEFFMLNDPSKIETLREYRNEYFSLETQMVVTLESMYNTKVPDCVNAVAAMLQILNGGVPPRSIMSDNNKVGSHHGIQDNEKYPFPEVTPGNSFSNQFNPYLHAHRMESAPLSGVQPVGMNALYYEGMNSMGMRQQNSVESERVQQPSLSLMSSWRTIINPETKAHGMPYGSSGVNEPRYSQSEPEGINCFGAPTQILNESSSSSSSSPPRNGNESTSDPVGVSINSTLSSLPNCEADYVAAWEYIMNPIRVADASGLTIVLESLGIAEPEDLQECTDIEKEQIISCLKPGPAVRRFRKMVNCPASEAGSTA